MQSQVRPFIIGVELAVASVTAPIWLPFFLAGLIKPGIWLGFKQVCGFDKGQISLELASYADYWRARMTRNVGSFYLGKVSAGALGKASVYAAPESSLIMIAPRGYGKSTHLRSIIRSYCQLPAHKLNDVILLDPVKELQRDLMDEVKAAGWNVVVIDPSDPDTTRYSPFAEFDVGRPTLHTEVMNFCGSIITRKATDYNSHFSDVPRTLLAASIVYALKKEPHNATLRDCLRIVSASQKELQNSFRKFASIPDDETLRMALGVAESVKEREYGSFISTVSVHFRPFQESQFLKLTEPGITPYGSDPHQRTINHGWNFADVFNADHPTFFFMRFGIDPDVTGPASRLLISNALYTRRRIMLDQHGRTFKRGLSILIDEAKELGDCAAIPMANNQLRKAGVNICSQWLTLDDIEKTYSDSQSVLQGSTIIYTGNISSQKTLEHACYMAGKNAKGERNIDAHYLFKLPLGTRLAVGNGLAGILSD